MTLRSWYAIMPRSEARGDAGRSLLGGRVVVSPRDPLTVTLDGRPLPSCVCDGVAFAWFDPDGQPPRFDLPRLPTRGWTRSTFDTLECDGQPLSVMRDLADYDHFETTHGYFDARPRRAFWTDGPECGLDLDFRWPIVPWKRWSTVRAWFSNRCTGLGYQHSDVRSLGGRFRTRHRVLPTPIDDRRMQVILGLEARIDLPLGRLLAPAAHAYTRRMFRRDIADDMRLWARPPRADDRAPLRRYRSWVAGFASETTRAASASA